MAELVREQVLRRTFQEVPHAVEVVIDDVRGARGWADPRARARVGRGRVAEGDPHRRRRADDQGGGDRRPARARARAGHARAPRPLGPRAPRLARATTRCWTGWASNERRHRGHGRRGLLRGARQPASGRLRPRASPAASARASASWAPASGDAERLRRALLPRLRRRTTAAPRDLAALRPARWPTCAASCSSRTSSTSAAATPRRCWRCGARTASTRSCARRSPRGAVLCGVSAGMNCWFEASIDRLLRPDLAPLHDGLGFVAGSACPHYDGESTAPPALPPPGRGRASPPGYAADDGAALHFDAAGSSSRSSRRARAPAATASSAARRRRRRACRCPRATCGDAPSRRLTTSYGSFDPRGAGEAPRSRGPRRDP